MRGTRLRGKGEKCKCRFARNKEFNGLLICGFADHTIVRHKKRELADIEWKRKWCPGWESNPHEEKSPEDFKSSASAIPPPGHRQKNKTNMEAAPAQIKCKRSSRPALKPARRKVARGYTGPCTQPIALS